MQSEKKSTISSLKGLLKRRKSKDKIKENSEKEKSEKTSPSLFRRFERKAKSQTPSPQHAAENTDSPSVAPVEEKQNNSLVKNALTKISPSFSNKSGDYQKDDSAGRKPGSGVNMGIAATTMRSSGTSSQSNASINYQVMSDHDTSAANSSQASPATTRHASPLSPRRGGALSPQLYKRVLTRNMSSSQESIEGGASPQRSPQASPKRRPGSSASLYSMSGTRELMGSPVPIMGTRALNHNTVSVTIGFKPKVESRTRTMREGTSLQNLTRSVASVASRSEMSDSRVPSPKKLGKRSSSMEILVCGKIREHRTEKTKDISAFSREGSFRLHKEISVETLMDHPETTIDKCRRKENYQEYLNRVQAGRDSQHSSAWSLCEIDECSPMQNFTPFDSASQTLPRPTRSHISSARHTVGPQYQHSKFAKKMSLPHNLYLSERSRTPDSAGSNPSLHSRSTSPFTRGMPHSCSFTSSPYRRPQSAAGTPVSAASPLKKTLFTSAAAGTDACNGNLYYIASRVDIRIMNCLPGY